MFTLVWTQLNHLSTLTMSDFNTLPTHTHKQFYHLDLQTHIRLFYSSLLYENHGITNSRMHLNSRYPSMKRKDWRSLLEWRQEKKLNKSWCFQARMLLQKWRAHSVLSAADRSPVGISILAFMFHENTHSILLNSLLCWLLFCIYYFTCSREAWNQTRKE